MINANYEKTPEHVSPVYSDVKSDAIYLLGKKGVRGMLLAGFTLSCAAITMPMLIAYAIMFSTPLIEEKYDMISSALIYASIWIGIFVVFPGMFCGMYGAMIKLSRGERITFLDLLEYYSSPRLFGRSIGIFLRGNWFLLGIGITLVISVLGTALGEIAPTEAMKTAIESSFGSLILPYFVVGSIVWGISRRFTFIFIPYAVASDRMTRLAVFTKSFGNDFK